MPLLTAGRLARSTANADIPFIRFFIKYAAAGDSIKRADTVLPQADV